ncbi:5377_t:CDS:2 [Diversispora eburnea]|uniref:5377_t:CDS:1 n=1 Tax=Diversispora eburnea TaxID=1213867 RepID=A0A9N9FKB3_9GLOM|nr:5377_t:CDS:2 [Diversispora eburnea]
MELHLQQHSQQGYGQIVCELPINSKKPAFSTLRSSYPLKFLTPKTHSPFLAIVYILSYGGGMNSMLLQLPGPTTCFQSADYSQYQKFKLEDDTSSLIVLDWFTSGRMSRGERWEFVNYKSGIDILIGDEEKLIFQKEKRNGVVIKIAGITTELVKNFLIENALKGLDCIIDDNLFERAL